MHTENFKRQGEGNFHLMYLHDIGFTNLSKYFGSLNLDDGPMHACVWELSFPHFKLKVFYEERLVKSSQGKMSISFLHNISNYSSGVFW